eukprot:gene7345-4020_t
MRLIKNDELDEDEFEPVAEELCAKWNITEEEFTDMSNEACLEMKKEDDTSSSASSGAEEAVAHRSEGAGFVQEGGGGGFLQRGEGEGFVPVLVGAERSSDASGASRASSGGAGASLGVRPVSMYVTD